MIHKVYCHTITKVYYKHLFWNMQAIFVTLSWIRERVKLFTAADSLASRICPGEPGAINWSTLGNELATILFPFWITLFWILADSLLWLGTVELFFNEKLVEIGISAYQCIGGAKQIEAVHHTSTPVKFSFSEKATKMWAIILMVLKFMRLFLLIKINNSIAMPV